MATILKLNAISSIADSVFPSSYVYTEKAENPDGIMVRSASMKDYDFAANPSLVAIARAGAGTNNIPCDVCAEKGIIVFNTPGANANAVKELVLCELFLGGRKIVDAANWVQTLGEDENLSKTVEKGKAKFAGQEIMGKTLGVIGLGAIGAMVANTSLDLGMNVIGYDPYISIQGAWALNNKVARVTDIKEIFKNCDYITIHVPLTPDTKNTFSAETLELCKDGVVVINNSRGELVDSAAMVAAVESGKVSRYITDFAEPDFIGKENILCLPHLGASTPEAEDNCAYMAASELVDYIENGNITNSVNYPACSMAKESPARLTVMHRNIKETLSKILNLVSAQGINIEHMLDKSKGDYAYLILDLDKAPSASSIEVIESLPEVIRVRSL